MESLRKYVTDQDLIERGIGAPSLPKIIVAERDIDTVIKNFYENVNRKWLIGDLYYSDTVFTTTTATIGNTTYDDNYFAFTAIEIMSGANKGEVIGVASSEQSGSSTILTFNETQTITAGTYNAKIWQEGKFPRIIDVDSANQVYNKAIPTWLKDCVAYQYLFREANAQLFNTGFPTKSYRVQRDSYQEDFDTTSGYAFAIENRTSPDALSILSDKGMLGRSV